MSLAFLPAALVAAFIAFFLLSTKGLPPPKKINYELKMKS
jgi:hypothetical protein